VRDQCDGMLHYPEGKIGAYGCTSLSCKLPAGHEGECEYHFHGKLTDYDLIYGFTATPPVRP
jgi:hypothetical protein